MNAEVGERKYGDVEFSEALSGATVQVKSFLERFVTVITLITESAFLL
jgi:hypothetical protein